MKTLLPWFLVIALSASAGALFMSGRTKDAEISKLREESQQAESARTELEQNRNLLAAQEETIRNLRKDVSDLPKLRGQVGQLQTERQALMKDLQNAKALAERATTQASQALQNAQSKATELANSQAEMRLAQARTMSQVNACINNLRQLDGAKNQWALEHNKTAEATPTAQDILPYFREQRLPVCPAGGVYTLNSISAPPVCSIPGHALSN